MKKVTLFFVFNVFFFFPILLSAQARVKTPAEKLGFMTRNEQQAGAQLDKNFLPYLLINLPDEHLNHFNRQVVDGFFAQIKAKLNLAKNSPNQIVITSKDTYLIFNEINVADFAALIWLVMSRSGLNFTRTTPANSNDFPWNVMEGLYKTVNQVFMSVNQGSANSTFAFRVEGNKRIVNNLLSFVNVTKNFVFDVMSRLYGFSAGVESNPNFTSNCANFIGSLYTFTDLQQGSYNSQGIANETSSTYQNLIKETIERKKYLYADEIYFLLSTEANVVNTLPLKFSSQNFVPVNGKLLVSRNPAGQQGVFSATDLMSSLYVKSMRTAHQFYTDVRTDKILTAVRNAILLSDNPPSGCILTPDGRIIVSNQQVATPYVGSFAIAVLKNIHGDVMPEWSLEHRDTIRQTLGPLVQSYLLKDDMTNTNLIGDVINYIEQNYVNVVVQPLYIKKMTLNAAELQAVFGSMAVRGVGYTNDLSQFLASAGKSDASVLVTANQSPQPGQLNVKNMLAHLCSAIRIKPLDPYANPPRRIAEAILWAMAVPGNQGIYINRNQLTINPIELSNAFNQLALATLKYMYGEQLQPAQFDAALATANLIKTLLIDGGYNSTTNANATFKTKFDTDLRAYLSPDQTVNTTMGAVPAQAIISPDIETMIMLSNDEVKALFPADFSTVIPSSNAYKYKNGLNNALTNNMSIRLQFQNEQVPEVVNRWDITVQSFMYYLFELSLQSQLDLTKPEVKPAIRALLWKLAQDQNSGFSAEGQKFIFKDISIAQTYFSNFFVAALRFAFGDHVHFALRPQVLKAFTMMLDALISIPQFNWENDQKKQVFYTAVNNHITANYVNVCIMQPTQIGPNEIKFLKQSISNVPPNAIAAQFVQRMGGILQGVNELGRLQLVLRMTQFAVDENAKKGLVQYIDATDIMAYLFMLIQLNGVYSYDIVSPCVEAWNYMHAQGEDSGFIIQQDGTYYLADEMKLYKTYAFLIEQIIRKLRGDNLQSGSSAEIENLANLILEDFVTYRRGGVHRRPTAISMLNKFKESDYFKSSLKMDELDAYVAGKLGAKLIAMIDAAIPKLKYVHPTVKTLLDGMVGKITPAQSFVPGKPVGADQASVIALFLASYAVAVQNSENNLEFGNELYIFLMGASRAFIRGYFFNERPAYWGQLQDRYFIDPQNFSKNQRGFSSATAASDDFVIQQLQSFYANLLTSLYGAADLSKAVDLAVAREMMLMGTFLWAIVSIQIQFSGGDVKYHAVGDAFDQVNRAYFPNILTVKELNMITSLYKDLIAQKFQVTPQKLYDFQYSLALPGGFPFVFDTVEKGNELIAIANAAEDSMNKKPLKLGVDYVGLTPTETTLKAMVERIRASNIKLAAAKAPAAAALAPAPAPAAPLTTPSNLPFSSLFTSGKPQPSSQSSTLPWGTPSTLPPLSTYPASNSFLGAPVPATKTARVRSNDVKATIQIARGPEKAYLVTAIDKYKFVDRKSDKVDTEIENLIEQELNTYARANALPADAFEPKLEQLADARAQQRKGNQKYQWMVSTAVFLDKEIDFEAGSKKCVERLYNYEEREGSGKYLYRKFFNDGNTDFYSTGIVARRDVRYEGDKDEQAAVKYYCGIVVKKDVK